jgi:superfamily II DNA or RNA helicase
VRRLFNKAIKRALYRAADGCSELSGLPLDEHWHADHIVPWSKGGTTGIENAQALTSAENLRKGVRQPNTTNSSGKEIQVIATMASPLISAPASLLQGRAWQARFFDHYLKHSDPDYLLAVIPAGGKTRAACAAGCDFLNRHPRGKLIIAVPSLTIRDQWHDEALKFGIQLYANTFPGNLRDPEYHGVVATYQTIAADPVGFQGLCSKHECMVEADEVHHLGEKNSWGDAFRVAFGPALKRLALTGTPFRTDGKVIPFLRVGSDGYYQNDFTYDFEQALKDGIVRWISFQPYKGGVTIQRGDIVKTLHTNDKLPEDDESRLLYYLLQGETFMREFLSEAYEKLMEVRHTKADAGGLVLCQDANHAVWVASLLEEITNSEPDLILSDGSRATSTAREFDKDPRRLWAVAVRQVSEGVDIKRLQVEVYATHWNTLLFFRQAIGRVMRYQGTPYDTEAYVFLPKDRQLAKFAQEIEEIQRVVIGPKGKPKNPNNNNGGGVFMPSTIVQSTKAEHDGLFIHDQTYEEERAIEIREVARFYDCTEEKAALFCEQFQVTPRYKADVPPDGAPDKEAELERLKREIKQQVNRYAVVVYRCNGPNDIHGEWMRKTGRGQDDMTIQEHRDKLAWLQSEECHKWLLAKFGRR